MTLLDIGLFFGVSFIAAAVNAVAGGGTFLTFPLFILNGLSPLVANIMSTIALWPGVLASFAGYRGHLELDKKQLLPFFIIGLLGGSMGALLLLSTPESTFTRLVPWLLLAATLIFTFGRQLIAFFLAQGWTPKPGGKTGKIGSWFLQSVIAVYGGYFGAGIGILTLAMLQLLGFSHIHRMNALKTILTGAINAVTMVIFLFSGRVIWPLAAVMVMGAICGGYFGARLALKVRPEKIRALVSIIGFSMTLYFFIRGV